MSWWFAAATVASGAYGADANRKGKLAQGKEFDRASKETMLTESYNRRKRNVESRQTDLSVYEQGARALSQVAMQGQIDQEKTKTESAGSGATVSSGTTLDVMMTEAVNNTVQQLSVVDATEDAIVSNQRQLKNTNESEYRNAKNRAMGLKRQADMTRKSAQDQYTADMLGTAVKAATVYASNKSPSKPGTSPKTNLTGSSRVDLQKSSQLSTWGQAKMYGRNMLHNMKTKKLDFSQPWNTALKR